MSTAHAATITVNNLADDVFPNVAGAIFDINGTPVVLLSPKCTLRMAIASANLDLAVGGANGCAAGSGPDSIVFAASLNLTATPGTITLADRGMSEAPAVYAPPLIVQSALIVSGPLTITGPGSAFLTIDGNVAGNAGRRPLLVSDGNDNTDAPFQISGLRFLRGRAIEQEAGCLLSAESATINDVIFESCESVGGPSQGALGGALGVGNLAAGTVRPDVTLTNAYFSANRATRGNTTTALAQAGAAFFGSDSRKVGKVAISNSQFLGNSAESIGAMLIRDASVATGDAVSMSSTQFISNVATGNAASLNGGRFGGFQVTRIVGNVNLSSDVSVVSNTANQERGGFSVTTISGTTTIANSFVMGNIAILGRIGGFDVLTDNFDGDGNCLGTSKNPVNISDIDIQSNLAATNTAGFRVMCSGNVAITTTNIVSNEVFGSEVAGSGGNSAGNIATNLAVTMSDIQIIRNRTSAGAVDGGSGVFNVFDNTSFDGTRFLVRDNSTQQNNSGVALRANGAGRNLTLTDSSLFDNTAGAAFSALVLDGTGNYTVKNSTFSGNRVSAGGTVFVNMNAAAGSNAVLLENVTSARNYNANTALLVNGGATPSGTVTVRNAIIGSGTAGLGFASASLPAIAGVTYAISNSIVENSSVGIPAGVCGVNDNLCNVDAKLENLALNGVATTRTHALRPGSPALDAGDNTGVAASDQRGFPRIVGPKVDIGAFESPALPALCTLDVDGNHAIDALTDGLILIRAMFGLTGTSVTNGAVGAGSTRNTWALIQPYLNGSCGASFSP